MAYVWEIIVTADKNTEVTSVLKQLGLPQKAWLKQALANADIGMEVAIEATDAGSKRDIPAFVRLTNHELIEMREESGVYYFVVRKGE